MRTATRFNVPFQVTATSIWSRTLRVLRQRAPVIAICVLLTGGAAFGLSKAQRKQYTATAQVLFRGAELDQQAAGLEVVNQTNQQPQTDTNLRLATLPRVATETAAALGHGLTQEQVSAAVAVARGADTDLAKITATWTSPLFAAQMANAYAQNVISGPAASGCGLLLERPGGGRPRVQGAHPGTTVTAWRGPTWRTERTRFRS